MLRPHTDAYGRTVIEHTATSLRDLLLSGVDLNDIFVADGPLTQEYNRRCREWEKTDYALTTPHDIDHSPEEEHARRQSDWLFPKEMKEVDVRDFVLSLCKNQRERDRVNMEMDLYERHELIPVLQLMIFLIDHFRSNKIIWGCGRGSSCASYVLFKIGVHRIDSLKYNLDIEDFLKH